MSKPPTPLLKKTPFVLDPRPLTEASSPHAGLLATSRSYRSLGIPDLLAATLKLRKRQRGYSEGQMVESLVLLQTVGGDCPEDMRLLANDSCLERGLGYVPPKVTAVREFLELFHDEELAVQRPSRAVQKSFIFPSTRPVAALQDVQAHTVRRIARRYEQQGQPQRLATVDQDATIIESHKRSALPHYQGGRGYQPMVAVWAEADLVLADEFRDGNVPARQAPLTCAQLAFAALPTDIQQRYFRGDSACHENELIQWLAHPERATEPGGAIGFGISAMMTDELLRAIKRLPEAEWTTFDVEADGTRRQWAEVPFVPTERYEQKDRRPLRYVGLRLLKPQGVLFADGSDRHHHALITNRELRGDKLLNWHREKAGTVEHVHDEIKNALGGGHMPSQRFAVNAAWFKLTLLSYNLASAIKGLCFDPAERTVRFKKYRLLLIHLAGRMNRNNCVMGLRLCAPLEAIRRMQKVWECFPLATQASAMKALGRASP
jgi:hypothetical protein